MASVIRIEPTPATRACLDRLAHMDIDKELRRELNAATQSVVRDIRAEILSSPSTTGRKTKGRGKSAESLRAALARAVKKHVRLSHRKTEISIVIEKHGGKENLARAVEGDIPWKHPTYGHSPDVTQRPRPFFWDACHRAAADLEYKIRRAVNAAFERGV